MTEIKVFHYGVLIALDGGVLREKASTICAEGTDMIKIERILCPTNLSPESDEALRYGVALARAYDAKLFLLYCGEAAPAGNGLIAGGTSTYVRRLFEDGLAPHLDWLISPRWIGRA